MKEAVGVYRQDLKLHPKNIWSLVGLKECLALQSLQMLQNGCEPDELGMHTEELKNVLCMIGAESARTGVKPPGASCACAVVKWKEGVKQELGGSSCCSHSSPLL